MSNGDRVLLDVVGLEFVEGGNTIWVHGREGTVLRIKCTGNIVVDACAAPGPHADMVIEGDIRICVPGPSGDETDDITVLTKSHDFIPEVPRPKNQGTRQVPSGGYAEQRRRHAQAKKLGKRRLRRLGWETP